MPRATVFGATCAIMSRMEPTDGALISAYQTGDEAAFATLVARHMRSVFNLALRLVADPAKAEDVAQETFVKACLKCRKMFEEDGSVTPAAIVAEESEYG